MPTSLATRKASEAIPYLFRFPLLYLEPICAFSGAILAFFDPSRYTATMTRGDLPVIEPASHFIYTELAGGWLYLAFTEAVVLRLIDDARVWRLLCMGMLLSDIAYCHSCAEAVGGWSEWLVIGRWTSEDWIVAITTWPFLLARVGIVLGIGERRGSEVEKKDS